MKESDYWNNFYDNMKKSASELYEPSNFCNFVIDFFKEDVNIKHVLDAGCGNGRDSYPLSVPYIVDGVDSSGHLPENTLKCIFYTENFVHIDKSKYDMIYSRFTFHSISNQDQLSFLKSIPEDRYLCIETRSDKSKYENRYFEDNHYRNFTNIEYLKKILKDNNFTIKYIIEDKGLAKYKDEDPYCIRVICIKNDVF